jgi:hypothetical protein
VPAARIVQKRPREILPSWLQHGFERAAIEMRAESAFEHTHLCRRTGERPPRRIVLQYPQSCGRRVLLGRWHLVRSRYTADWPPRSLMIWVSSNPTPPATACTSAMSPGCTDRSRSRNGWQLWAAGLGAGRRCGPVRAEAAGGLVTRRRLRLGSDGSVLATAECGASRGGASEAHTILRRRDAQSVCKNCSHPVRGTEAAIECN